MREEGPLRATTFTPSHLPSHLPSRFHTLKINEFGQNVKVWRHFDGYSRARITMENGGVVWNECAAARSWQLHTMGKVGLEPAFQRLDNMLVSIILGGRCVCHTYIPWVVDSIAGIGDTYRSTFIFIIALSCHPVPQLSPLIFRKIEVVILYHFIYVSRFI